MPKPRKQQISLDSTPYYHCISRCVHRAYLFGFDKLSQNSYEHRRQWVEDRILFLAEVFCIDVCAYTVMSNHHHVVLHINAIETHSLSDMEVCQRWHKLYKGTLLTQKYHRSEALHKTQWQAVKEKLDAWRLELGNISRFMLALNELIARMANKEDKCTGRFWDRFLLLHGLRYLNPVRAKMAKTLETSEHTSIKRRIESIKTKGTSDNIKPLKLADFIGNPREPMPEGLPFQLKDYIELVDITGRAIREDKRGYIDQSQAPTLDRLDISSQE